MLDIADKLSAWNALREQLGIAPEACAHIGDDLPDVPVMRACGFAVTVPHAPAAVREHAHYVTSRDGGAGAVRELAELILAAQGHAPSAARRRAPHDRASCRAPHASLDRATAWSPVLLLGGLAALTYWLDSQVQPPAPRRDGSERHDPDIYVEGFRAVELDAQGRPTPADRRQARAALRRRPDDRNRRADAVADRSGQARVPRHRAARASCRATARKCPSPATCARCARPGPTTPGEAPAGPVTVTTEYLHVVPGQGDRAAPTRR